MLPSEFVVLFYLEKNNYTIKSFRSIWIHPQKAKNAIENLKKIWMIQDLWDWVYWVSELITSDKAVMTEQIISLRWMLNCVKEAIEKREKDDWEYYKKIKYLFIDEPL